MIRDARAKDLLGRTIVAVDFRPFRARLRETAHDPVLTLDNGRKVYFITEETDIGEYGTRIGITVVQKKGVVKP